MCFKMQNKLNRKRKTALKLLLIVFVITITNISLILNYNTSINSPLNDNEFDVFKLPKTSAGEISIKTPENLTYTRPMSGYYPATYSFENELEGSSGTAIDYVDSGSTSSNCEVKIYNEFQGHKKVLRIHDGNPSGNAAAQNNFASTLTTGSVEWWWSTPVSGSNTMAYHFHEGLLGTHAGIVLMQDDNFIDMEDNIVQSYVANQWYHHKVVFNTISDTYDWYIDRILRVDDGNFLNPVTNIGSTNIKGGWDSTGSCYLDAIGHSCDMDYDIGANMNEGLLLSYDNTIPLDWVGYSLDDQTNKTILGNTSITMSNPGLHNIQLFANDTSGIMYESELRYFTVDISEPTVSVITPLVDQYFGVNAPSFSVDIQGFNLDKRWYSLDNGITNISFMSVTGGISQSEWNKFAHEPVQIRFYANNSSNQIGFDVVTVNKDLNAPITTMYFVPYSGINRVIISTQFLLSATDNSESGVSTIQYKINDIAWIPYTGVFSLSGYDSGFYSITYQSIDAVGNIETQQSVVVELYIPPLPPEIPNLVPLLLTIIGIGTIALLGITIFLLVRRRTPKTPIKARKDDESLSGSDQLKVCPFCFAQIKINAKYCTFCGASLEKD